MEIEERIANADINVESMKSALKYYIMMILKNNGYENSDELGEKFTQEMDKQLKQYENQDLTKLTRFYRLIILVKPVLNLLLIKPGKTYDTICDTAVTNFNVVLDRIRRQLNDWNAKKKINGPIISGSNSSMELRYYCTVCNKDFEIPQEIKDKINASDEKIELPTHCEKEMVIKIVKIEEKSKVEKENFIEIKVYPAEVLMMHSNSMESKAEYLEILSVGIDIGSSTSHLVFSRLTLKRERSFFNMSSRFILINREIIYEGNIIFTPLIDKFNIDIEAIIEFCKEEYKRAGVTPEQVQTGAVIVTGETAKKQNADEIVRRLSSESGKFVSASAGPNFESLISAMGSGIVDFTNKMQNTIMNVDIGGGTSNLAIASKGKVHSTSCINVGGRLLGIDKNFKIWRIDEPTEKLMKELNMKYQIGDTIPEEDVKIISQEYAKALIEVMKGPAVSKIAKLIMMTEDMDFSIPIDGYSFSGGVAEMIYGKDDKSIDYRDIGRYLAKDIKDLLDINGFKLIEPENKIRATVIGAGAFSLAISGSTCYYDENMTLPLLNVPVLTIEIDKKKFSPENLKEEVSRAFKNFDMIEGKDIVGLYFRDPIYPSSKDISILAKAIINAIPNSVANEIPIILLFNMDLAKLLGLAIRDETSVKCNIICLDELDLQTGDWIDIGAPLETDQNKAFPITIKSLVFNQNKK